MSTFNFDTRNFDGARRPSVVGVACLLSYSAITQEIGEVRPMDVLGGRRKGSAVRMERNAMVELQIERVRLYCGQYEVHSCRYVFAAASVRRLLSQLGTGAATAHVKAISAHAASAEFLRGARHVLRMVRASKSVYE